MFSWPSQRKKSLLSGAPSALLPALAVLCLQLGCSRSTPNGVAAKCSSTQSLLRWGTSAISFKDVKNAEQFLSHGGFLEVYTRSDVLGKIDTRRLCTAYVEFTDNPAVAVTNLETLPLQFNVFTATHCLDLSKDYALKLHLFDGSVYESFWIEHEPLKYANDLRAAMRAKLISPDLQRKVMSSLRMTGSSPEAIFNAPTASTDVLGTGPSNRAGTVCLQANKPEVQHVCATYQDLTALEAKPVASTPSVVLEQLKDLRAVAVPRASNWIASSNLKNVTAPMFFQDEASKTLSLVEIHAEMRRRVKTYSKFKSVQNVLNELAPVLRECLTNSTMPVCTIRGEFAAFLKAQMSGTGYESFEGDKMEPTLEAMRNGFVRAVDKMDKSFTIFESLIVADTTTGVPQAKVTSRVHSNFRFVPEADGTNDVLDPMTAPSVGRAFLHINVNNLTADNTGRSVNFIRWVAGAGSSLEGRFAYFSFPKKITDEMRTRAGTGVPHMGYMQAGDSGSIVVVEHLPMFAITTVDGATTSGGTSIRPLPEPKDDAEFDAQEGLKNSGSATQKAKSVTTKCR